MRQFSIVACAMTLLWVGNIIEAPSIMLGQTTARASDDEPSQAVKLMRQEFVNTLAGMIGQSVEILAIHTRDSAPYTEIVLWRSDRINPGVIDANELAVISHCRLFKTVTLYEAARDQPADDRSQKSELRGQNSALSSAVVNSDLRPLTSDLCSSALAIPPPRPGGAAGPGSLGGQGLRVQGASVAANMMLDRTLASHPGFCDRWRGSPQVQPQVLGTDLSDFTIEPAGPTGASASEGGASGGELSVVGLSLRWAADSTDGAQEISVVVNRLRAGGR